MKKISFAKEEIRKTGKFLIFFVLSYLAISGIFYSAFPLIEIEKFTAGGTTAILKIFGINGKIFVSENVLIQLENGINILISELCTGLMELFIIVSAIIASFGIEWKKKLFGIIASIILLQIFNFARIVSTIFIILGSNSIETIEFSHNILFRIFLFIAIAGIYIAWFAWAVKENKN